MTIEKFVNALLDFYHREPPVDFYNLLFLVLLAESKQSTYKITEKEKLYESRSKTYRIISNETKLNQSDFFENCKALNFDIPSYFTPYTLHLYSQKIGAMENYIHDCQKAKNARRNQIVNLTKDNVEIKTNIHKKNSQNTYRNRTKVVNEIIYKHEELRYELDEFVYGLYSKTNYDFFKQKISGVSDQGKNIIINNIELIYKLDNNCEMFMVIYLDMNKLGRKIIVDLIKKFLTNSVLAYTDQLCENLDKVITSLSCPNQSIQDQDVIDFVTQSIPFSDNGYIALCLAQMDNEGLQLLKQFYQISIVLKDEYIEEQEYFDNGKMTVINAIRFFMDTIHTLQSCRNAEKHLNECITWHNNEKCLCTKAEKLFDI